MSKRDLYRSGAKLIRYLKSHAPSILSGMAVAGVGATAVTAARAGARADFVIKARSERKYDGDPSAYSAKEAVRWAWKYYVPTGLIMAATTACIIGSNALNKRQQGNMAAAYGLLGSAYQRYREKTREICGEEAHRNIMDALAAETAQHTYLNAGTICGNCSLDFGDDDPKDLRLFYDRFSGRYFESTVDRVIQAEYHLNRNFMLAGYVTLNDFYDFLGLEHTNYGSNIGWSNFDGDIYWVDFDHYKQTLDNGTECYVIDMVFDPCANYFEEYETLM